MSCGNHATAFVMQIKLNVLYNIYCGEALAVDCCAPIMSCGRVTESAAFLFVISIRESDIPLLVRPGSIAAVFSSDD